MNSVRKEVEYFDILNLSPTANIEDVKKAYKKLAKEYHPDRFQDANKKKEAEKQFNVIKKAYDAIIESYESTKNDINLEDIVSNIDFINFFTNQEIEETINKEFNDKTVKDAVEFINTQIKVLDLNMLYVYECVRKDKMFIHWDVNNDELQSIMVKEVLFRRHIKKTPLYKAFIYNKQLFTNPHIHLKIKIKPEFSNKKFDEKITYKQPFICSDCLGKGCVKCHDGILYKKVEKRLKFSKINNYDVYQIDEAGFQSPLCEGSLKIRFVFNSKLDERFVVEEEKQKKKLTLIAYESADIVMDHLRTTCQFIAKHKVHASYISVITVLLTIIIVLASVLG